MTASIYSHTTLPRKDVAEDEEKDVDALVSFVMLVSSLILLTVVFVLFSAIRAVTASRSRAS